MSKYCFIAFFLVFFAAPSANASLCEKYDKPITAQGFINFAGEVKEQFPAKYRHILDEVILDIDTENDDKLFLTEGDNSRTITVSSSYLRSSCTIAMRLHISERQNNLEKLLALGRDVCENHANRRKCFISLMDATVSATEQIPANQAWFNDVSPILDQMVLSSFRFALAHEYGHVINGATRGKIQSLAKSDAELAADLQAVMIFASGRAWPISDTVLFSGRRMLDTIADPNEMTAQAHDSAECRAARSNAIRALLAADLAAINEWRANKDLSSIFSMINQSGTLLLPNEPSSMHKCAKELPDVVSDISSDLKLLNQHVAKWPKFLNDQAAWTKLLSQLKLKSDFGKVTRNGMLVVAGAPLLTAIQMGITDGNITPVESEVFREHISTYEDVLLKGEIPDQDVSKIVISESLSRFFSVRPGSSAQANIARLTNQFDILRKPNSTDVAYTMQSAVVKILNKDCQAGYALMLEMLGMLRQPMQELTALMVLNGSKDEEIEGFKNTMSELDGLLKSAPKDTIVNQCEANGEKIRTNLKNNFGWVS